MVVLAIVTIVTKLSIEDSQRKIVPVCPVNVNVPELLPVQTVAFVVTVPPTELPIVKTVAVRQSGYKASAT